MAIVSIAIANIAPQDVPRDGGGAIVSMAIVSIAHHSIVHIKAQPNLHNPGVRVGMAKLLISHVLTDSRAHLLTCHLQP